MKNKTYKIIILSFLIALIFATFAIPSFANADTGYFPQYSSYTFKEDITAYRGFSIAVEFTTLDKFCTDIYLTVHDDGFVELTYAIDSEGEVIVYDSNSGWLDVGYRTIIFQEEYITNNIEQTFFVENEYIPPSNSLYDNFYNILTTNIYGDRELTSFEILTATILSTLGCVAVIALPLIVVFWAVKFFFTLGRNW